MATKRGMSVNLGKQTKLSTASPVRKAVIKKSSKSYLLKQEERL